MPTIMRPSGIDVSVFNPNNSVYVKGSETIDGSQRFQPSETNPGAITAELNTLGAWDRTELDIASSTLHIGHEVALSSAGSWLETTTLSNPHTSLIPRIDYNEAQGTQFGTQPILSLRYVRHLYQSSFGSEVIGTDISDSVDIDIQAINDTLYLKGGSIAATEPVTIVIRNDSPVGPIFWKRTLPAQSFPAGKFGAYTSVTTNMRTLSVTGVSEGLGGIAVFTTSIPHNLFIDDGVTQQNFSESSYNISTASPITPISATSYSISGVNFVGDDTGEVIGGPFRTLSVVSVADNGEGISLFTTSAPHNLTTGDAIIQQNFSEASYNSSVYVGVIVTSTTSYEIITMPFVGNDTGETIVKFLTISSLNNGLTGGENIRLRGAVYNKDYVVYDTTTDTFNINQVFVGDDSGNWIDNVDIKIDLRGGATSSAVDTWYVNITSPAPVSLITNLGGEWWFGVDLQKLDEQEVVVTNLLLTEELDILFDDELNFVVSKRFENIPIQLG